MVKPALALERIAGPSSAYSQTKVNGSDEPIQSHPQRMTYVSLAVRQREPVQRMAGFKKTHRVPEEVNTHTQSFVARLAAQQVKDDLDKIFEQLRIAFRFKRTEIQSSDEDGSGTITTPYFRYGSTVFLNPDDASEAIWHRNVSDITSPNELLTDRFASVFGTSFNCVEFTPPSAIDLEALIDRIEAIADERISLQYDRLVTACEISLAGSNVKLRVTAESFQIVHPQPAAPRTLVQSLFDVQAALVDFSSLDGTGDGDVHES